MSLTIRTRGVAIAFTIVIMSVAPKAIADSLVDFSVYPDSSRPTAGDLVTLQYLAWGLELYRVDGNPADGLDLRIVEAGIDPPLGFAATFGPNTPNPSAASGGQSLSSLFLPETTVRTDYEMRFSSPVAHVSVVVYDLGDCSFSQRPTIRLTGFDSFGGQVDTHAISWLSMGGDGSSMTFEVFGAGIVSAVLSGTDQECGHSIDDICFGDGLSPCAVPPTGGGCTLTQGFWKNHNVGARGRRDQPWPIPETTILCGATWLEILRTPTRGNAWYILAHQWIAARLNVASGAPTTPEVAAAILEAGILLAGCTIDPADRSRAIDLNKLLTASNEGRIGPGHCGEAMLSSLPLDALRGPSLATDTAN